MKSLPFPSLTTSRKIIHVSGILLATTVGLVGCATAVKPGPSGPAVTAFKPDTPIAVELRREQFVGWWYGDQPTKEGGRVQWIMRRSADGTFRVTFRTTDFTGKASEQTEVGEWGVNANLLVTVTRGWFQDEGIVEAFRADSYFWDVYEVHSIDSNGIKYRSVEGGNEYQVRKVANGFSFPQ